MRILIVEDEYNLADAIKNRLTKEKYIVDISIDGNDGVYNALTGIYDLIILDIMLPNVNGIEILKQIRENNIDSKIIMLTAKDTLEDKLTGFNNGADDYLTKPFYIDELVARINVLLIRGNMKDKNIIKYGDLELNIRKLVVRCNENEIELVCKEFQLLEYFINNSEQILTKEQIYDKIWGIDSEIESNNLEAYLSFLRKKLKAIGSHVSIKAIRGVGYKMEDNYEKIKE